MIRREIVILVFFEAIGNRKLQGEGAKGGEQGARGQRAEGKGQRPAVSGQRSEDRRSERPGPNCGMIFVCFRRESESIANL